MPFDTKAFTRKKQEPYWRSAKPVRIRYELNEDMSVIALARHMTVQDLANEYVKAGIERDKRQLAKERGGWLSIFRR